MAATQHSRLPAFLRQIRQRRGLRQNVVAASCGVTRTHLCALEQGRVVGPSTDLLAKLALALQLSPRELATVARLSAQDRVLRAAATELPDRAQRLVSVCLELDRLLPAADVDVWLARLDKAVQDRSDFIVHIQLDEEVAMS